MDKKQIKMENKVTRMISLIYTVLTLFMTVGFILGILIGTHLS